MLDAATRIANLYGTGVNGLGIKRIPTTSDPLYIVRDDTTVDPLYSSWSKKIYLESDDVVRMNETVMQQMLAHEMFHWVENKTYIMFMKGGDTAYTWDMETRAETATFLIDPSFQTAELLKRGAAFHSDQNQILGWQEAGKDWATDSINLQVVGDPDRYVHGFMVRMGLCTGNDACQDNRTNFARDINLGTRLLFGYGEKYPATLPNTAKYLLGFAPENAVYEDPGVNFAASELQTGRDYGDYIHVSKNYSEYVTIFSPVNLEKNKDTGVVTLHAKIGKLGIYPLRVSNGADKPIEDPAYQGPRLEPNVPYSLTINKGVRFFYRVGTELIERDGREDTTISPISSEANVSIQDKSGKIVTTPGIPVVRLVAINDTEGDLTLTGTLMPIEPLIKVDPLTINLNNKGSTETTIQVNLSQIFLNIKSFKIVIDYGDGDPPVIIDAKPDADGKVDISDKHRFLIANRDVKAVTLSFKDKDGKSLGWPDYVIPVEGGVDASRPKFNQIGVEIIFGNTNYNPHYSYLNQKINFTSGTFTTTPNDFIHGSVTADYKAITVILNVNDHKIELNDIPKINLDDLNKTYTYGVCTVAAILPHVLLDGATPNWTPEEGANGRECVMIYFAETK